jgi:hypothetical protein
MSRDVFSGRRMRERIPAKLRKQALEKAKNICQYPKCKISSKYVVLQAHHRNLKNDNNRLSNIKMLCPTHHAKVHHKQSKKYKLEQVRSNKKRKREELRLNKKRAIELKKKKKELKLLEKKKKKVMKANALKKKKAKKKVRRKSRGIFDDFF